jgi:hypothetical protein
VSIRTAGIAIAKADYDGSAAGCHAHAMEILGYQDDAVDLRLSHAEANGLYNLLADAEAWPNQARARPFIRQVREALHVAVTQLQADD